MSHLLLQADARRLPFPDRSVDLVFGSPPYTDSRIYLEDGRDLGIARDCIAWVEWMIEVTLEAQRVSRGPVVWVAAGKTKDRNYWPACEGLMWEWWKRGGDCHLYRPCYWHRVGISGSGGDQWFRADIEHVMCFKRAGKFPWANNLAMGKPCKYGPGGDRSHRNADGQRISKLKGNARKRKDYVPPEIANPGNLIRGIKVGGGHMGSDLAHENEAPFPEGLAEFFVRSLCPPGGTVLDPFSGSGTTAAVAAKLGRRGIGTDLRRSQCELGQRRIADSLRRADRPHAPVQRAKVATPEGGTLVPLPGQRSLFDAFEGVAS